VIPNGFLTLTANDLPFGLAAQADWIILFDPNGNTVDSLYVQGTMPDQTSERIADGANEIVTLSLGTPGSPNYRAVVASDEFENFSFVDFTTPLRYHIGDHGGGDAWRSSGFDDSTWDTGSGIFGTSNPFAEGITFTNLEVGPPTSHYFRGNFTFPSGRKLIRSDFFLMANAGAVAYLNGQELVRLRMPEGPINPNTLATTAVAAGMVSFEQFEIDLSVIQAGENGSRWSSTKPPPTARWRI
jgi:hypothetical protein